MAFAPCLLAMVALAVPASVHIALPERSAAPSPSEAGSRQARALVLARLMVPEDLVVEQEIMLAKRDYRMRANANPRSKRLEATYPGIHMSVWAEVEPQLRRLAADGKPALWARQAARLQSLLTARETEALITLYSTSVGRRIVRATVQSVDSYPDRSRRLSPPDERKVAAVADGLGDLTAEDEAALLAAHRLIGRDKLENHRRGNGPDRAALATGVGAPPAVPRRQDHQRGNCPAYREPPAAPLRPTPPALSTAAPFQPSGSNRVQWRSLPIGDRRRGWPSPASRSPIFVPIAMR